MLNRRRTPRPTSNTSPLDLALLALARQAADGAVARWAEALLERGEAAGGVVEARVQAARAVQANQE
jgi:hypothetical protein